MADFSQFLSGGEAPSAPPPSKSGGVSQFNVGNIRPSGSSTGFEQHGSYEQGLKAIDDNVNTGVYYHAVGKQKGNDGKLIFQNDMMQTIWEYSLKATGGDTHNAIPDPKTFQSFEYSEGAKQYQKSFPLFSPLFA